MTYQRDPVRERPGGQFGQKDDPPGLGLIGTTLAAALLIAAIFLIGSFFAGYKDQTPAVSTRSSEKPPLVTPSPTQLTPPATTPAPAQQSK